MSAAQDCYRVPEDVIWLEGDEEVRLYDAAKGEFLTLNRTAAEIWMLITEGQTVAEITELLGRKYSAGNMRQADQLSQQVTSFVESLAEQGLLTSRTEASVEAASD